MIGIRTIYRVNAPVPFTSDIVPATVGLTSPIAAGGKQKFRAWIPINVGATGGVALQVAVPAAGVLYELTIKLFNTVAPSITTAIDLVGVLFGSALANAGDHWLEVEGYVENGVNAGSIDIQMCQNSSDVLTLTVDKGGTMEVVTV